MKYSDVKALLNVNHNLKAKRSKWDNAFITIEGDTIIINQYSNHEDGKCIEASKRVYTPSFQDMTADDWEIIP